MKKLLMRGAEMGSGHARVEQWQGREFLVVPVVGMVDGAIIRAMNSTGPERVPLEPFKKTLSLWEGKPLFLGHPLLNGRPVLGATRLAESFGVVRYPRIADAKFMCEAWMDAEKAPDHLLERARANDEIQISIGALVRTAEGDDAVTEWRDVTPDHLALLPGDVAGACNYNMGCGVRAACEDAQFGWAVSNGSNQYVTKGEAAQAMLAHNAAATQHTNAAAAHDASDAGAHMQSKLANAATKMTTKTGEGQSAHDAAQTATQHSLAGDHAAAAQSHRDAAKFHRQAAASPRGANDITSIVVTTRDSGDEHAQAQQSHQMAAAAHSNASDQHVRANTAQARSNAVEASRNADQYSRYANRLSQATDNEHASGLSASADQISMDAHTAAMAADKNGSGHDLAASLHEKASNAHAAAAQAHGKARYLQGGEMYQAWLEAGPETDVLLKVLRNIPQSERDKMPKEDFAGPNQSFPIAEPVDVHDAAQSLGRAKGDQTAIKARIIEIAHRKGAAFVAQLPDAWKVKAATGFQRFISALAQGLGITDTVEAVSEHVHQMEAEMTKCELEKLLANATPEQLKAAADAIKPPTAEEIKAAASKADAEKVIADKAAADKALADHAAGLKVKAAAAIAAIKATGKNDLNDAALEALSLEQLEDKLKALSAPKEPTFEELLAKASPEVRAAIDDATRVTKEKKAATIKALRETKRCDLTDRELEAKSQNELDMLVKLASVTPAVDYSGMGGPRQQPADANQAVAAPQDLTVAVRAASAKK